MKYQRLISFFGIVVVALWGQAAAASSVALTTGSPIVAPNDTFTVELMLDANDVDGLHPGDYSGQIAIMYDPNLLTLESSSAALTETRGATAGDMGYGFGNIVFNEDPDVGMVGSFEFRATGALGVAEIAVIGVEDAFGLTSFANSAGGINEFFPQFSGTNVTVQSAIPLPAAAWLFLSALGALGFASRKSRAGRQAI